MDDIRRSPNGRFTHKGEVLGRGAFKVVFKAFDTEEARDVAWNQVPTRTFDNEEINRMLQEVRILQMLEHPHIINLYDTWHDEDALCFITEYMTSGTLHDYVADRELTPAIILKWGRQIASGLDYLHSYSPKIIHRDLKCSNIFVNGASGEVKIGDLGLSTIMRTSHAESVIGTPEYMAPEFFGGLYDERVDIWAFGMVLLEMATKQVPYAECSNPAMVYQRLSTYTLPESLELLNAPAFTSLRALIELCLLPAESRPTIRELIAMPILQEKKGVNYPAPPLRFKHSDDPMELNINLQLREDGQCRRLKLRFVFDQAEDTVESVAAEMVQHFNLSEDVRHDLENRIQAAVTERDVTSCQPTPARSGFDTRSVGSVRSLPSASIPIMSPSASAEDLHRHNGPPTGPSTPRQSVHGSPGKDSFERTPDLVSIEPLLVPLEHNISEVHVTGPPQPSDSDDLLVLPPGAGSSNPDAATKMLSSPIEVRGRFIEKAQAAMRALGDLAEVTLPSEASEHHVALNFWAKNAFTEIQHLLSHVVMEPIAEQGPDLVGLISLATGSRESVNLDDEIDDLAQMALLRFATSEPI